MICRGWRYKGHIPDRRRTLFFRIFVIFVARKDSKTPGIRKFHELPRRSTSKDEGAHQYEISNCIVIRKRLVADESCVKIVIFGLSSLV